MTDNTHSREHKTRRKAYILICVFVGIVIVTFLAICIGKSTRVKSIYSRAEEYIAAEEYQKAQTELDKIEDKGYKDTASLSFLCQAHTAYDAGNLARARYVLKSTDFSWQTEENMRKITAFTQQVNQEYDAYQEKQEQLRQEEEETARIAKGVPYVGMPESRIADTSLGAPSSHVRHDDEVKNGQQIQANLYDFYESGVVIFTARCVQGTVTEVWDCRDNTTPSPSPTPSKSTTSGSTKSYTTPRPSKSAKKETDDPYNAKDYYDAEDFYDDNYDDFFDFEDAEDYFEDHND